MKIKNILVCDEYFIKEKFHFSFLSNPLMSIIYSTQDRILKDISQKQFDIIIVDIDVIGIFNVDITELFNVVQHIKKQSFLPIIFVTTSYQEDISFYIKLINIEVYKCFIKPFNPLLFDQAVYDVLMKKEREKI